MSREPSTAARALRAVSLAITLISIVTFATIAYSAYVDASGVLSSLGRSGSTSAAHVALAGNTAKIDLNISLSNSGLYPLGVRLSCAQSSTLPVSCGPVAVSVQPGMTKAVALTLSVTDLSRLRSLLSAGTSPHLNATASVSLEPFATLSVTFDLGSVLSGAAS